MRWTLFRGCRRAPVEPRVDLDSLPCNRPGKDERAPKLGQIRDERFPCLGRGREDHDRPTPMVDEVLQGTANQPRRRIDPSIATWQLILGSRECIHCECARVIVAGDESRADCGGRSSKSIEGNAGIRNF